MIKIRPYHDFTILNKYRGLARGSFRITLVAIMFSTLLTLGTTVKSSVSSNLQVYAQEILPEICDNLIDDDNNGLIDYEESCIPPPATTEGQEVQLAVKVPILLYLTEVYHQKRQKQHQHQKQKLLQVKQRFVTILLITMTMD